MSGDRVDRADEAIFALERADKQGDDALGDALRLEALVHATLALAEQQRLANMIALVARNDRVQEMHGSAGTIDGRSVTAAQVQARNEAIFVEVRQGLGL